VEFVAFHCIRDSDHPWDSFASTSKLTLDQLLQVPLVHPSATEVFQECAKGIGKVEVG
jgi:hypothetical protein